MGGNYNINIVVREFLEPEIFGIQRYLTGEDLALVAVDASQDVLDDPQKAAPENQRFLDTIVRTAKRGKDILSLKHPEYDPERIKAMTPDIDIPELPEAAACFFERVLQVQMIIPYLRPGCNHTVMLRPDAHNTFVRAVEATANLYNKRYNGSRAEFVYSEDVPETLSTNCFFGELLFDLSEKLNDPGEYPYTFMGRILEDKEVDSFRRFFELGRKEVSETRQERRY